MFALDVFERLGACTFITLVTTWTISTTCAAFVEFGAVEELTATTLMTTDVNNKFLSSSFLDISTSMFVLWSHCTWGEDAVSWHDILDQALAVISWVAAHILHPWVNVLSNVEVSSRNF